MQMKMRRSYQCVVGEARAPVILLWAGRAHALPVGGVQSLAASLSLLLDVVSQVFEHMFTPTSPPTPLCHAAAGANAPPPLRTKEGDASLPTPNRRRRARSPPARTHQHAHARYLSSDFELRRALRVLYAAVAGGNAPG